MTEIIEDKYLNLSNAELKIKLTTLENEYEATKAKLKTMIEKMASLDKEYSSIKQVLNKRTRGKL